MASKLVNLIGPDGEPVSAPAENLAALQQQGFSVETPEMERQRKQQEKYGGIGGKLAAGALGAGRGATFGGTDALGAALGFGSEIKDIKEANPTISTIGEVGGAVASAVVPAGPVAAVGRFGSTLAKATVKTLPQATGATGQMVARATELGLGAAVEGVAQGIGQTVTEASLGDPQKAAENLMGNIGMNALLGAGLGSGASVVGDLAKGFAKKLPVFNATVDEAGQAIPGMGAADLFNRGVAKSAKIFGADEEAYLGLLRNPAKRDAAQALGKNFAEEIETTTIPKLQELQTGLKEAVGESYEQAQTKLLRTSTADSAELIAAKDNVFRKVTRAEQNMLDNPEFFDASTSRAVQQAKVLLSGNSPEITSIRTALDDAAKVGDSVATAELGQSLADAEAKALISARRYLDVRIPFGSPVKQTDAEQKLLRDLRGTIDTEISKLPNGAEFKAQDKLYAEFREANDKFFGQIATRDGEIDIQKAINSFRSGGAKGSKIDNLIEKMDTLVNKFDNPQLQDNLTYLKGLREQIGSFKDYEALKVNLGPSGRGALTGGVLATTSGLASAGTSAAVAAIASPVIAPHAFLTAVDSTRNILAGVKTAQDSYAQSMSKGVKAGLNNLFSGTTARAAIVTGTRKYDLSPKDEGKQSAFNQFKKQTAAVQAAQADPVQTADNITKALGPIANEAPALITHTIATTNAGLNFLASKIPTNPVPPSILNAGAEYRPSVTDIVKWERYSEAVRDPASIIANLSKGTLSLEAVEAMKAVYPSMYEDLQAEILEQVADKKGKDMPRQAKLQLGILFSAATVPSLQPQALNLYQQTYAAQDAQEQRQENTSASRSGKAPQLASSSQTGLDAALNRRG